MPYWNEISGSFDSGRYDTGRIVADFVRKHDAFLCSKLIGTLSVKEHGLKGLVAGPPVPDYKRVFSFAVKKGDTELLEKLNRGY